jgi:two-component system, NtrC family, response regulator
MTKNTTRTPIILIIDDDRRFCETMMSLVSRMNHQCLTVSSLKEALGILKSQPIDLVFLDVFLPDGNGIDYIETIKHSPSEPEVIMLTGQGDPDGAELAIQKGVWDYLVKPSSVKDTRLSLMRALMYRKEKRRENLGPPLKLSHIIGSSPEIKACFDVVGQAARTDSNVLITGETGTGKELFARTIHDNSPRANEPFVIVDCAALPKTLVESILFGHKKGSFTGATTDRIGLVGASHKGTLFLDEIGELPVSLQKTFLRVLQEKRFRPVGATREITSDFRLIAATNRDLESMVEENTFRQDLLFRICTITLNLPPLRERWQDVDELALAHIRKICSSYKIPAKHAHPEFFSTLTAYPWPGNVRQLFNVVERTVIASGNKDTLYPMDLPQDVRIEVTRSSVERSRHLSTENTFDGKQGLGCTLPTASEFMADSLFINDAPDLKQFKSHMEKKYLEEIIRFTNNNIQKILEISGLSRSHFYALLKKNHISSKTLIRESKKDIPNGSGS